MNSRLQSLDLLDIRLRSIGEGQAFIELPNIQVNLCSRFPADELTIYVEEQVNLWKGSLEVVKQIPQIGASLVLGCIGP